MKVSVKHRIRQGHAQALVQNQDRFARIFDKRLGERAGLIQRSLEAIDILKAEDGALDFVFPRFVGPDAEQVPRSVFQAHFPFLEHGVFDGVPGNLLQVVRFDVWPDFAQPPAHVPAKQVQQFFGRRHEAPDAQIIPDHDLGEIDVSGFQHEKFGPGHRPNQNKYKEESSNNSSWSLSDPP